MFWFFFYYTVDWWENVYLWVKMYWDSFLRTDEAPLVAVKASSLLGFKATSSVLLHLGIFSHSSLQILSGAVRLGQTICEQVVTKTIDWDGVRFLAGLRQRFYRVGVAQFGLTLGHLGYNNIIKIMSSYLDFSHGRPQSSCGNISTIQVSTKRL